MPLLHWCRGVALAAETVQYGVGGKEPWSSVTGAQLVPCRRVDVSAGLCAVGGAVLECAMPMDMRYDETVAEAALGGAVLGPYYA